MAYTKQTWNTGDTITAEKLNHMEDGIGNSGSASLDGGIPDFFYGLSPVEAIQCGTSLKSMMHGQNDYKPVLFVNPSSLTYYVGTLEYFIPFLKTPLDEESPFSLNTETKVLSIDIGFGPALKLSFFPLNSTSSSCNLKLWFIDRTDPSEWKPEYEEVSITYSEVTGYWTGPFSSSSRFYNYINVKYDSEEEIFSFEIPLSPPEDSSHANWNEKILLGASLEVSKDEFSHLGFCSGDPFIWGLVSKSGTEEVATNELINPLWFNLPEDYFDLSGFYNYSVRGLSLLSTPFRNYVVPDYTDESFKKASGSRLMTIPDPDSVGPMFSLFCYDAPIVYSINDFFIQQISIPIRSGALDAILATNGGQAYFTVYALPLSLTSITLPSQTGTVAYYGYVESPTRGKVLFELFRDYESSSFDSSTGQYSIPEVDIPALKSKGKEVCPDGSSIYLSFINFTGSTNYSTAPMKSSEIDFCRILEIQNNETRNTKTKVTMTKGSMLYFNDVVSYGKSYHYPEGNTTFHIPPELIWANIRSYSPNVSGPYSISLEETT